METTPPPHLPAPSPLKLSASSALVMLVFTLVFTGIMAGTYELARAPIARSQQAEQLRLINEILPPASYDNQLLDDLLTLPAAPELGLPRGARIWRARLAGQPAGLVMEAAAPDGYAGEIAMVIAVRADGTLAGVRVTHHKETPGLGDYIDPKKDRNKQQPWIAQFAGRNLASTPAAAWTVSKDGGAFSYRTGATISARAVTETVGRALSFAQIRGDALYAPAGEQP
jgi:Na+-translocating ferredoxin:NAD+ oxidoreductase subunit G